MNIFRVVLGYVQCHTEGEHLIEGICDLFRADPPDVNTVSISVLSGLVGDTTPDPRRNFEVWRVSQREDPLDPLNDGLDGRDLHGHPGRSTPPHRGTLPDGPGLEVLIKGSSRYVITSGPRLYA